MAGSSWKAALLLGAAAVVFATAGSQARSGDPAAGERLAERWCSSCHVVSGAGTDAVPSLEGIARGIPSGQGEPATARVRRWLADPHPPMPNLSLSDAEIADVVAYLETLAR
ncbi:cytochrome c (plasmid) [Skermanella rosea]|uniref:c-type cytochrome n=1 Tax=Skermanella rosea TaxID=1817965 RepID=UPI00193313AF|nr:cytochrome c [Skermanella rosea]UEM07503.1 cytochrome c [Skermanella rosea]